jgi:hypothetical protein
MIKKKDDSNLLPTFNKHSQLKIYGIWILKIQNMFPSFKISKVLYHM